MSHFLCSFLRKESGISHIILEKTNTFAKELGFSNGTVFYQIKSGRNGISPNLAKKICDACPEIDYKWLLTGLGEMLNNIEVDNSTTNKIAKDIVSLKNHILELEIKIKKLEKELKSFYDAIEYHLIEFLFLDKLKVPEDLKIPGNPISYLLP
ncbi:helix-turn-helix domain-containing protein [Flavobacteriaceae bacterium]|nr:helix-turn-helix domain-containing protein [Flavobacteriaceae bacterium]